MAIGPFVFEFSTSYSVPRSCALSMQSHQVGASRPGIFQHARTLFLTAIAVNIWYEFAIVLSAAFPLCM